MFDQLVSSIPGLHDLLTKGLASNQFFVGMVGTGLLGGVLFFLRSLPSKSKHLFIRHATSSLTIRDDVCGYYPDISRFLSEHRVGWYGREFTYSPIHWLGPGYGTSFSRWDGVWIKAVRSLTATANSRPVDQTVLVFWSRNEETIRKFIAAATYRPQSDDARIKFSRGSGGWTNVQKPKRTIESVFANKEVIDTILFRLTKFRSSEALYARRGTPYKFCAVLEGPPGTGKTSLIHAIASMFDYTIYFLRNLNDINHLAEIERGSMVVIEDIDTLGELNRDKRETQSDLVKDADEFSTLAACFSMHSILNTLDGLATPHGLLVFITTNKIGDLDQAILRPGRVDLRVHVGYLDLEALTRMFVAFYEEESRPLIQDWIARNGHAYEPMSGASLQAIFLTQTAEEALRSLTKRPPSQIKVVHDASNAERRIHEAVVS